MFNDKGMPLDTLKYFELAQWAYDEKTKLLSIARDMEKKSDERGPARCDFEMKKKDGEEMLAQMGAIAMEVAKQKKADMKVEKATKKAAAKTEKDAEDALADMGDKKFDCGKQSITVGGTGVQIWEGEKFIQTIMYQNMNGWNFDDGKKGKETIEISVVREGKKKDTVLKLKSKESKDIAEAMTAKALEVKKAAKAAKAEKKKLAKELEGEWKVVHKDGTQIREDKALDSAKVGVIKVGEIIMVDEAEPGFNGTFKTRMHLPGQKLKLKNGDEKEVTGWTTMKNDQGVDFVLKVGSEALGAAEAAAAEEEAEPPEGEPEKGTYQYKALIAGKIRKGSDMASAEAGTLVLDEVLEVTERVEVGDPAIMRVKFDRGWASVTSKKGTLLLELLEAVDVVEDYNPLAGSGTDSESSGSDGEDSDNG